jgi:5-methylcytosine-specific restriction endonuclease McrA
MTSTRPSAVPKPKPRVVVQRERRAALTRLIRAVRTAVWRRDGGRCRACAGRAQQLHHVRYRSQGGRWTTANCVLLCRACHQDVHARILAIGGSNADDPRGLTFERRAWW